MPIDRPAVRLSITEVHERLKYRAGALQSLKALDDATIVLDPYQRESADLRVIGTRCRIVGTMQEALISGWPQRVALFTTVPELATNALQSFALASGRHDEFTIVTATDEWAQFVELLRLLPEVPLALTGVGTAGDVLRFDFQHAEADDQEIEDFLDGIRVASSLLAARIPPRVGEEKKTDALQQRLLSALSFIRASYDGDRYAIVPGQITGGHALSPDDISSASYRELENRLLTMSAQHDALQRKYDALASSVLGRTTLRVWAHRKRGG